MGEILATCLKGQTRVGVSMYHATTSAEAKHAMVRAAVETSLPKRDQALFNKITKAIKPVRDRRNEFVHHIWATSEQLPNCMLLIDPRDELVVRNYWQRVMSRARRLPKIPTGSLWGYDPSRIAVYRKSDFQREVRDASAARICVSLFQKMLNEPHPKRGETRKELLSQPLLARLSHTPPH